MSDHAVRRTSVQHLKYWWIITSIKSAAAVLHSSGFPWGGFLPICRCRIDLRPQSLTMPLLSLAVVLFLAIPPFVLSQISLANIVEDDNLFPFETAQITDATIASLSVDDVPYFGWAVNQSSSSSPCKNFPGNASWPSDAIWARFNAFTGDAVIKTVPIGAPCYPGTYQNAEKCAYISVNWGNSTLQQVYTSSCRMVFF